jgi:predicted DNA binding CopG/RHH family protein
MKRKVPRMTTDEEAEAFLEQDLSDLDFSQFKPVKFEFQAKAARLNMRLPVPQKRNKLQRCHRKVPRKER